MQLYALSSIGNFLVLEKYQTLMPRKHHRRLLSWLLWRRLHQLEKQEHRHLLPPGQHLWGGDLRPGRQLCWSMLGSRCLALSIWELCGLPWKLWDKVPKWRYRGWTKWRVNCHFGRKWSEMVHRWYVQSANSPRMLLQSKLPDSRMAWKSRRLWLAKLNCWTTITHRLNYWTTVAHTKPCSSTRHFR